MTTGVIQLDKIKSIHTRNSFTVNELIDEVNIVEKTKMVQFYND